MFDPLPDDLASALEAAASDLGPYAAVHYLDEVGSTNDAALALAASGAVEGTSVLAGRQRQGRGRRGGAWHSPAGAGLYLSVIVGPGIDGRPLPLVTIGAGVAVAEAVASVTGLPVELKWPNDIVIGRPWRKLGGLLTEAVTTGSALSSAVVGIGLNLHDVKRPDPIASLATSIEAEVGQACNRAALLVVLLTRLREIVRCMRDDNRRIIVDRWRRFARNGLGGRVHWSDASGERAGHARDIDEEGALIVAAGRDVVRVVAGTVAWEGLSRE